MGKVTRHDQVQQILPWFVNDSLTGRESVRVLGHLRQCSECRQERDRLQRLQREVASDTEPLPDYRFAFRKLMARINAAEQNRECTESTVIAGYGAGSRTRWRWKGLSMAGVAAVLIAGVYFAGFMQSGVEQPQGSRDFLTLTVPIEHPDGREHRVALTFEEGVSAETVRSALIEVRSRLVDGPDATGAYILDVKVPESMSRTEYIDTIRNIDGIADVSFMERPVAGEQYEQNPDDSR